MIRYLFKAIGMGVLLFGISICQAQTLEETLAYLNDSFKTSNSQYKAVFSIDSTGQITISLDSYFSHRDSQGNFKTYLAHSTYTVLPFDIFIDHSVENLYEVTLKCVRKETGAPYTKCFSLTGEAQKREGPYTTNLLLSIQKSNTDEVKYVINALNHILELSKELNSRYRLLTAKTNPFAKNGNDENRIKMVKNGTLYYVPVEINGVLKIKFMLDTGASDLFLSPDVYATLLRSETLSQDDYMGTAMYSFANGKIEDASYTV